MKRFIITLLVALCCLVLAACGSQPADSKTSSGQTDTSGAQENSQTQSPETDQTNSEQPDQSEQNQTDEAAQQNTQPVATLTEGGGTTLPAGSYVFRVQDGSAEVMIKTDNPTTDARFTLSASPAEGSVTAYADTIATGDSVHVRGSAVDVYARSAMTAGANTYVLPAGLSVAGRDVPAGNLKLTAASGNGTVYVYGADQSLVGKQTLSAAAPITVNVDTGAAIVITPDIDGVTAQTE